MTFIIAYISREEDSPCCCGDYLRHLLCHLWRARRNPGLPYGFDASAAPAMSVEGAGMARFQHMEC